MRMFNDVNFRMKCPSCGENITGFQTMTSNVKDRVVEPDTVNSFYSSCGNCFDSGITTWINFSRDPKEIPVVVRKNPLSEEEVIGMGFVREVNGF